MSNQIFFDKCKQKTQIIKLLIRQKKIKKCIKLLIYFSLLKFITLSNTFQSKNSTHMNDLDLQLSHQIDLQQNLIQEKQFQPDLLIQPITTQSKFTNKNKQLSKNLSNHEVQTKKSIESIAEQVNNKNKAQDDKTLAEQARKFRQYLNEKVQQLRKSQSHIDQSLSPQQKTKNNTLRKIINRQEIKQKQNDKLKHKQSLQKPQLTANPKSNNAVNKTSIQIKRNVQPSTTSVGTYINESNKKQQHEKKFSNSHSNLIKNIQKNNNSSSKHNIANQTKKSLNLQSNNKSTKLPQLTPKLKIPFPSKNQSKQINVKNQQRKNTIDSTSGIHHVQQQKGKRNKTPQSKNSFRIKRTSNVQQNQPQTIIQTKKSKQVSLKTIAKEKQSPAHQGKSKKMRDEFIRLNQQEKRLQQQILKNHQTNKQIIDSIVKKYNLSMQAFQKYGIKKQTQFPNQEENVQKTSFKKQVKQSRVQKQIQSQIRTQSPLKKQKRKNTFLDDELEKINNLLKAKDKQIQKSQSRFQRNAYVQYLKSRPQDILQQSEQDQIDDEVQQLPDEKSRIDPKYDPKEFSSTYSSVMSEMKNKKWALKQRITFQTHRQENQKDSNKKASRTNENFGLNLNSNKKHENSRLPSPTIEQEIQEGENKIQVNSRLKRLLLQ